MNDHVVKPEGITALREVVPGSKDLSDDQLLMSAAIIILMMQIDELVEDLKGIE